jgi:hypothetical protein
MQNQKVLSIISLKDVLFHLSQSLTGQGMKRGERERGREEEIFSLQ